MMKLRVKRTDLRVVLSEFELFLPNNRGLFAGWQIFVEKPSSICTGLFSGTRRILCEQAGVFGVRGNRFRIARLNVFVVTHNHSPPTPVLICVGRTSTFHISK